MPPDLSCQAIVLAAGGSTRMGEPKGLLLVDGVPLAGCHARGFLDAGLCVTIVLGSHEAAYRAALGGGVGTGGRVRFVVNTAWASTTLADSLRLAHSAGPAIVTPVDVPPARASTIAALLAVGGDATVAFEGVPGHPARLASPLLPGERLDVRLASAPLVEIDDRDCLLNLNTPGDWRAWQDARFRPPC